MTSNRKRKKQAEARGFTVRELELVELMEEVLESLRWLQVLGYTNQYLLDRRIELAADERDRILEAATRVVDKDGKLHEWQARLARIKSEGQRIRRALEGELQGPPAPAPEPPPELEEGASGVE